MGKLLFQSYCLLVMAAHNIHSSYIQLLIWENCFSTRIAQLKQISNLGAFNHWVTQLRVQKKKKKQVSSKTTQFAHFYFHSPPQTLILSPLKSKGRFPAKKRASQNESSHWQRRQMYEREKRETGFEWSLPAFSFFFPHVYTWSIHTTK